MKFDLRKEAQRGNDLLEQVRGDMEQVKKELAEMETKLPGFSLNSI